MELYVGFMHTIICISILFRFLEKNKFLPDCKLDSYDSSYVALDFRF